MIDIRPHPQLRGTYQLSAEQFVPSELDEVFAFFSDAYRLQDLTPPFLNFQVLTKRPISLRTGTLIDYQLSLHGIPIRWQSEISDWQPPHQFVDRQIKGPYRLWHHRHTFEKVDGGTLVRDVVDYAVPGGWLIDRLIVRRDLLRIFRYRCQQLEHFFGKAVKPPGEAP